jgi:hypothetical protein
MTFRDSINCRCDRVLAGERQNKLNERYKAYVARKLNKPPRKVPSEWDWELLGQTGVIRAFTRSEARAQLKERFDLKRVPKEVILVART